MKTIGLIFLLACIGSANTCTLAGGTYASLAASSGHWSGTGCTTTPGSGDTATLSGTNLTIALGETWTVGSSPADHTGTPAIASASGADTSVLNVAGTVVFKGPVHQGNAIWTFAAGATAKCDASGAATPAAALYPWEVAESNNATAANLVINGTAGSHVTFTSSNPASYNCGSIGSDTTNWGGSGRFQATYWDVSYFGTAARSAVYFLASSSPSGQRFTCDHCTLDHTGAFISDGWDGSEIFSVIHLTMTNPLANPAINLVFNTAVVTTGSRTFSNNFVSVPGIGNVLTFQVSSPSGVSSGLTADNNVIQGVTNGGSGLVADFSGNYMSSSLDALQSHTMPSAPTMSYDYSRTSAATHNHLNLSGVNPCGVGCAIAITNNVFEMFSSSNAVQDSTACALGRTAAGSFAATGNILLPTPTYGLSDGDIFNPNTGGLPSWTAAFDHNTFFGSTAGNSAINGETDPGFAGHITSVRHNISWQPTLGQGAVIHPLQDGSAMRATGTYTVADYNWLWNIVKYTGTNYSVIGYDQIDAAFSSTPGVHDVVNVNPQFIDTTRSVETFWNAYLGNTPSRGAWLLTNSYAIGDTVSDVMPSGIKTYWRAIATISASTANSEPALGSFPWTSLWEPAAEQTIGASVVAGQTFNDGGSGCLADAIVTCTVKWIRAGFAVQNPAAWNGPDGLDYGAVHLPIVRHMPPAATVN